MTLFNDTNLDQPTKPVDGNWQVINATLLVGPGAFITTGHDSFAKTQTLGGSTSNAVHTLINSPTSPSTNTYSSTTSAQTITGGTSTTSTTGAKKVVT